MNIKATSIAQFARNNPAPNKDSAALAAGKSGAQAAIVTLALTTEPGTLTIASTAGERPVTYDAGEVVISNDAATTIAGPLSRDDAIALATAVLEGRPRAVTHPQLHLLLAGAVLAFACGSHGPEAHTAQRSEDDP